jgi:hypothetical protein
MSYAVLFQTLATSGYADFPDRAEEFAAIFHALIAGDVAF